MQKRLVILNETLTPLNLKRLEVNSWHNWPADAAGRGVGLVPAPPELAAARGPDPGGGVHVTGARPQQLEEHWGIHGSHSGPLVGVPSYAFLFFVLSCTC
jgi:hypothetical protein